MSLFRRKRKNSGCSALLILAALGFFWLLGQYYQDYTIRHGFSAFISMIVNAGPIVWILTFILVIVVIWSWRSKD